MKEKTQKIVALIDQCSDDDLFGNNLLTDTFTHEELIEALVELIRGRYE